MPNDVKSAVEPPDQPEAETDAFGDYPAGDPVSRFFAKRLVPAG